ncbi:hypothetical protein [Noviherbaspirillum humi]|uniref:hypothetical protein n=1 Tax=Noviherbaspirillum humi TaxID=1688639 RepID=UPI001160B138|nr:hypothetical protein [Noviherbaspirillum humi]
MNFSFRKVEREDEDIDAACGHALLLMRRTMQFLLKSIYASTEICALHHWIPEISSDPCQRCAAVSKRTSVLEFSQLVHRRFP